MRRLAILTTIAALTSASLLGGCGVRGDLATPPPLWGEAGETPPESTKDRRRDQDDNSYPELGSDFDLEDDDI